MQGKRLSVQVDYDKEGVSYSATAELGVVGAARVLTTHLYDLESAWAWLQLGWHHVVVVPSRRWATTCSWQRRGGGSHWCVQPGRWRISKGNVPMNQAELNVHLGKDKLRYDRFRVADILLKRHSAGRYELFATHYYFTGECYPVPVVRDDAFATRRATFRCRRNGERYLMQSRA